PARPCARSGMMASPTPGDAPQPPEEQKPAAEKPIASLHLDVKKMPQPDPAAMSPAEWMYRRIVKAIVDFETSLDKEHEIGMRLVSFANREVFNINNVGFWNPDMIIFFGISADGQPVELIQHMSQLNIMLVAAKKMNEEAQRIGFQLAGADQKLQSEIN